VSRAAGAPWMRWGGSRAVDTTAGTRTFNRSENRKGGQFLESVHAQLRKIIKTRGHFPTDEAATKLIWLALRNITAKWERGPMHWKAAMAQFAILYEGRFTTAHA